MMMIWHRRSP